MTVKNYYSASISGGLGRTDDHGITEFYTDSFSYANQFVAMRGYADSVGYSYDGMGGWILNLHAGIRGHWDNYASAAAYVAAGSMLTVEHEFSGDDDASALWGFRDLYPSSESGNIPADPVSIPPEATCVGIINNGGTISAVAGNNEKELKAAYGSKLVAVIRGSFRQESGSFVFTNGAAALSPALTATWTEGSGRFSIASNGTVTAKDVHISTPTFKLYQPKYSGDTSLQFKFTGGKLSITINPENNKAILHIDIPGATCRVETVGADLAGTLNLTGELKISTPWLMDAVDVSMSELGFGWKNQAFSVIGVKAAGSINMSELLGMEAAEASAEINTFPGEERCAFEMELNVYEMFEAKGELELKRIMNGALIPNTLKLRAAAETGIPLVSPVVVAELNGLGGGFSGLADTINGDFFALPPLRLSISAKGSVLEIIEGWYTLVVGAGYYSVALTEGELLKMDIIDEYSWYVELSGEIRKYLGTDYSGLKLGGGMKLDLSVPNSDKPYIKGGGEFNASAFAGLDSYTSPTRAYLALGADAKLYGLAQIPASAWFINRDFKLASAQIDLALGGQTTVNVTDTTFNNAIKDAFGRISGYGCVAYTGSLIGFPFRIYYIFQNKSVGIEVGTLFGELDPFDPNPYKAALLDTDTGRQVGMLVMSDNITKLGSGKKAASGMTPLSVVDNDAADNGVVITQTDPSEMSYKVEIEDDAAYMAFSLSPDESWAGTTEDFLSSLTVIKDGEATSRPLVAALFDADGAVINEGIANVIIGESCLTLKLPENGTWTIASDETAFDISCYYISPYATLANMDIDSGKLQGSAENMGVGKNYVLRTYLGAESGGMDYLLSQSDVPAGGTIFETLSLSGNTAPSGSYYMTTVLLEEVAGDYDGDGVLDTAYVTTDTYLLGTQVEYQNTDQPNAPTDVTLTSIGSEMMRVKWKAPTGGPVPDGYSIKLYEKNGDSWVDTGCGYQLEISELTPVKGFYTLDMAVTAGDKNLRLSAGKTYKASVSAFRYLGDGDGDGTNDSLPLNGSETMSGDVYLPKASYPVLSYSPEPVTDGDSMKLLLLNGSKEITVTSNEKVKIVVTRMDTGEEVIYYDYMETEYYFTTPDDFSGALNLKITAKDAEGDVTVDYIGLRLDDTAPVITLDRDIFRADRETGVFTITGVTEGFVKVSLADINVNGDTNGADFETYEVTADGRGAFSMSGTLSPADPAEYEYDAADSATVVLQASDGAGNSRYALAQIVRSAEPNKPPIIIWSAAISTDTIRADAAGRVSAQGLKNAADAAGRGGTVTINMDGGSVILTGAELQSLIAKGCALRINTSAGSMLISAQTLAGLQITQESRVEFILRIPDGLDDSELQKLADAGHPVYEISILIDYKAVHKPAGTITLTLQNAAFPSPDGLRVIHALDGGVYQTVDYTYDGSTLTFTLTRLSFISVIDAKTAAALMNNPFDDVSENDWFYNSVMYAYQTTLMLGTEPDAFSPQLNMTRAMAVTVLYRMSGDGGSYERSFSDVPDGSWYEKAVAWAAENNIARGTGDGTFSPAAAVSREELAAMLYNFARYKGCDVTDNADPLAYTDASDTSDYALAAMKWACGNGIMNGDDSGRLNPRGKASRAEVAAMLQRFADYLND